MESKLISYKTAKLAKEKHFEEICHDVYVSIGILEQGLGLSNKWKRDYDFCAAPTQTHLRNWLLLTKNIHIELRFDDMTWEVYVGEFTVPDFAPDLVFYVEAEENPKEQFYEALERGLQEALRMLS